MYVVISTTFITSSLRVYFVSRNYFLCSPLCNSFVNILPWNYKIQSHLQAPLLNLGFLLFTPHLQLLPPLKCWTPQNQHGLEPNSSKSLLTLMFLPLPVNHKCSLLKFLFILLIEWWLIYNVVLVSQRFLMASTMVNPFHNVFHLLCPDPSKESSSPRQLAESIEDEMIRRHQLNGREWGQTPGDSERHGSLARCSPWSCKE